MAMDYRNWGVLRTCNAEKRLIGDRDYRFKKNPRMQADNIMHSSYTGFNLNCMARERHNFSSCFFNDNAMHMGVGMCSDVLISEVYSLQRCVGDSFAQDSNMNLHLTS